VHADDGSRFAPLIDGRRRVFSCHRATLSGRHVPNSLQAVDECITARVPRLEIDVRFLTDDAMLVFHDDRLDHETTGTGKVSSLDRAAAAALRYRQDERVRLCFLEDVVDRMRGSDTVLQVDLKLMRPITPARARALEAALQPVMSHVLVGSQAHWNLRHLRGLPLALDPTLQWHSERGRHGNVLPRTLGLYGFWDDSPLATNPHVSSTEYVESRVEDLRGLLPAAVEWMVDIATIEHVASLGIDLGNLLGRYGVSLAGWTLRSGEPHMARLLGRLYRAGVETVITDVPRAAGAAAAPQAGAGGGLTHG
jgi:glycerophosphoryl diester phosphodiesterase